MVKLPNVFLLLQFPANDGPAFARYKVRLLLGLADGILTDAR